MSLEQEAALAEMLRLVESDAQARCREIAARAQREAHSLRRVAHAGARERMRRHVQELKALRDRETGRARAALATAHRQQQQRGDRTLLETGWALLRAALARRWQEPAGRRRWIDYLTQRALARLPRGQWTLVCPAGWDRAEREALGKPLTTALGMTPEWKEDRGITAGLRLCAGGACLDGTLDGLLVDRAAVEALLLAELGEEKK